ncbi:MAG: CinA family protein [Puniceicoccales bacterium]|jgi:PncC family amidohydrolase|nr:CinA family protein [Puniceicoccales bacterium]
MDFRSTVSSLDFPSGAEYRIEPFEGDGDIHSLIDIILSVMRRSQFSLALSESLTGGMLSSLVVGRHGASTVFKGADVVYSLSAHEDVLGIPGAYMRNYGIESVEIAAAAAKIVLDRFSTTHAIAISGFASQWDGAHAVDIGVAWMAFQTPKRVHLQRVDFSEFRGQKNLIREKACYAAVKIFLQLLFAEAGK